ncbi:hypothetical protein AB0M43_05610 [Longispora sp. NPDC051575]|uniref:hypothetical protein n=1 Tax=Longispora sp. NPDC051575 TaxID=3154943 RepID=UPI00341CD2E8
MWLQRDPPSRLVTFGGMVAIQLVAMTLPVIGASTTFALDTQFVVWLTAYIGALTLSLTLFGETARAGWLAGVWVLAFFLFVVPALAVPESVLAARGVTIDATVVAERKEHGKGQDRVLTLADGEGRRIPGHAQVGGRHPVGGTIAVVVDPEGLFHPVPVEVVEEEGGISPWAWTYPLPFVAVLFALSWFAAKPLPPEPSYPTRPPPPPPPRRPRRRRRGGRGR